jgi:hypothetical protein
VTLQHGHWFQQPICSRNFKSATIAMILGAAIEEIENYPGYTD